MSISSTLQALGAALNQTNVNTLPALGAAPNQTTVSGMSSGGFMAVQMHTIYSSFFKGLGVVAGGPFGCNQCDWVVDVNTCTLDPNKVINIGDLIDISNTKSESTEDLIDNPSNISG